MHSFQPIVSIRGLSHRYSENWAVQNINIEINEADVLGLLGSNGAGKSTTMNIICGVLNQTEGEVLINGINMQEQPEEAKKLIGFLPQDPPLYFDFTVEEYLVHCAHLRLMEPRRVRDAMSEAMEWTGLTRFRKRLIRNLSGGYRRRVGIAQAIIHKPKLVVLDEPTAGLDPNQITEVRSLIKEISEESSVLLSTHIMSEVRAVCRDVIMIEEGEVVFSDTIEAFNNHIEPHSMLIVMDNIPAEERLLAIDGLTGVEILDDRRIRLSFDLDRDITKRVIEASIEGGWGLREISLEASSLEAVFNQLSGEARS